MANLAGATFKSARYASVTRVKYRARTFVLVKPSTYMNLCGKAVKYWMEAEKLPIQKTLVVVDDIALPLGTLRMKKQGGDGGHNGLLSIIEQLGTEVFPRLRIGIGNEFSQGYQVDYVLGKWERQEEEILIPKLKTAVDMIRSFGTIGIERTMSAYNNR